MARVVWLRPPEPLNQARLDRLAVKHVTCGQCGQPPRRRCKRRHDQHPGRWTLMARPHQRRVEQLAERIERIIR